MNNIEQSEKKLAFLRRLWKQASLDTRNPNRKRLLAAIERKAKWHKDRIAKLTVKQGNTVAVKQSNKAFPSQVACDRHVYSEVMLNPYDVAVGFCGAL